MVADPLPPANTTDLRWKDPGAKCKTVALVNLTGFLERLDEQILPSLYNVIGLSFHATPSQLGSLTLCRALVQGLSSPIGGLAGMHAANWYHCCSPCIQNLICHLHSWFGLSI